MAVGEGLQSSLGQAPGHASGEIALELGTPAADGSTRVQAVLGRQVAPPTVRLALELAAPDAEVQRPLRRAGIDPFDEETRAFCVVALTDGPAPALRVAGLHPLAQVPGLGPPSGVAFEVRQRRPRRQPA